MIELLLTMAMSCSQVEEIITRIHRAPDLTEEDRAELVAVLSEESGCAVAPDFL